MKNVLFYSGLILLFLVYSCDVDKGGTVYSYENNFGEYIEEAYDLSFLDLENKFVFVIPINSCSPCVTKTLEFLNQHREDPQVLGLILADRDKDILKFDYLISSNENLLFDFHSIYAGYELGIFKPTLIKIHNRKVQVFEELSINNFDNKIDQYNVIEMLNK